MASDFPSIYTAFVLHIVLLTTLAYSSLADELMLAGFKVTEALWADEVLHLLETEHIVVVVITHDFDEDNPELPEVRARLTTLRLQPEATIKDLMTSSRTRFLVCFRMTGE